MSKFLKGTLILMMAGLITRVLGFINRIVVARFIGEEGVGLFMMAFPTLILVITITQMGIPVAISKNVAEAEARGDFKKIKKILVVSLAVTLSLSVIFTPALILLAPYLSHTLFTDPRTYYPLVAIAPIVPIVAISSVIRGYFQGRQNMAPAAFSQVIEQIIRILLIAIMTRAFLPYGIEYAAAGAMIASVLGELASLIYLFTAFKLKKKFKIRKNFFKSISSGKQTFKELMEIALPATGSRMIGSLSWFFEPIVVSHSLAIAGVAAVAATKQYGALTGYALPLLMLPSFITVSLSTSLVPAISEANSKKEFKTVEHRLQQALRFSLITGGLAVILLYVFAEPLMEIMYGSKNGAGFIKLMAPFFIFYYYQGPLQAVLQALNLARAAMINSLIGAIVKTAVIFLLATQPQFGINGAALGIVVGTLLVTLLHFMTVMKVIPFTIYVMDYVKFLAATLVSALASFWLYRVPFQELSMLPRLLGSIMVMCVLYTILLWTAGLIKRSDIVMFRKLIKK
ncbi:stage V sporulation protein B [Falsibacillus pallidus]|uniref:Stage V sporulation protein B n=1 Tax=Falsibacillus pallidus TaxID=493781 RepID=A0A370GLF7_9BACI|nr:stage V sporulation protein B [Falsibacillus pallidus]RDI44119.1 stage V sporulation protein B [Falsibacillus pallidus]